MMMDARRCLVAVTALLAAAATVSAATLLIDCTTSSSFSASFGSYASATVTYTSGGPCVVNLTSITIVGAISVPDMPKGVYMIMTGSTIGSISFPASSCKNSTFDIGAGSTVGVTLSMSAIGCHFNVLSNATLTSMSIASAFTNSSVTIASGKIDGVLQFAGAVDGGGITCTDSIINSNVFALFGDVYNFNITLQRVTHLCPGPCIASTVALLQSTGTTVMGATLSLVDVRTQVPSAPSATLAGLIVTAGLLKISSVTVARATFNVTSTAATNLLRFIGMSQVIMTITDAWTRSPILYAGNDVSESTITIVNATGGSLFSVSGSLTLSTLTVLESVSVVGTGSFFVKFTGSVAGSNVYIGRCNLRVVGTGTIEPFYLGSTFTGDQNRLLMADNTLQATLSGCVYMLSVTASCDAIVIIRNTFNITVLTSASFSVFSVGASLVNLLRINGNYINVKAPATTVVITIPPGFAHVARMEVRYNTMIVTTKPGSAAYGVFFNQISPFPNITAIGIEHNNAQLSASAGAVEFVHCIQSPNMPTRFSLRNNTVNMTSAGGLAKFLGFTHPLTTTYVDVMANTITINGGGMVFSFISGGTGIVVSYAENRLYGVSTRDSSWSGASTFTGRCNYEGGVLLADSVGAYFGGSSFSTNAFTPCGTCDDKIDCAPTVTTQLSTINASIGKCQCTCVDSNATVTFDVVREDQCLDVPRVSEDVLFGPVVTPAPAPPAGTTTTTPQTTTTPAASTTQPSSTTEAPTTTALPITTTTAAATAGTNGSTAAVTNTSAPTAIETFPITTTTTAPTSNSTIAPLNATASPTRAPQPPKNISAPAPTSVPAVATTATQTTTGVIIGVGGAVGTSPGWSTHAGRSSLIAGLIECPEPIDPEQSLDPLENPIGLKIGSHKTKQYLGAIVGDFAVMAGLAALQLLIAVILRLLTTSAPTMFDAVIAARLPRANYLWWLLLIQPCLRCGLVLASNGEDLIDFLVGVASFTIALASAVFMAFRAFASSRDVYYHYYVGPDEASEAVPKGVCKSFGAWLLEEPGHWRVHADKADAQVNHMMFKPLYNVYLPRGRYFLIFELLTTVSISIVGSLIPVTNSDCLGQAAAALGCTLVYLAAVVLIRPCDIGLDNLILFTLSALETTSAGLIFWFTTDQNQRLWARDTSQWTSTITMWLLVAAVLKDCISAIVRVLYRQFADQEAEGDVEVERFNGAADGVHGDGVVEELGDDDGGEAVESVANPILMIGIGAAAAAPYGADDDGGAAGRIDRAMRCAPEDWEVVDGEEGDDGQGLLRHVAMDVFFDPAVGHYYDCGSGHWFDPETSEWYVADGQESRTS